MSDDIDILNQLSNINLSSVQTSFPLLATGLYDLTVAEMKVEQQKAPKVGNNIKIKLTTQNPSVDIDGKQVNPGFPMFDTISLTKSFKEDGSINYDPAQKLAAFKEAVTGSKEGSFGAPAEWAELYVGKTVQARVTYSPTSVDKRTQKDYGPQSRIDRYVKQKK